MPKYNYVALDARGKETKGTIEVASQNEAIGRVKEMGLFPTKIVEAEKVQEKAAGKKAKPAGQGRRQKKGRDGHPDQDPRLERARETEGADHVHPAAGDAGGRRPAAVARIARAGKTGAQRHAQGHSRRTGRWPSKAAALFPRRWRSIPRFSTACSSTWSRPANWAACWKWS